MVFYEPGKTDHGLPRDPFKVLLKHTSPASNSANEAEGLRRPPTDRLDKHTKQPDWG